MTSSEQSSDGVVRTFRSGPSDPVVFADGPGTWVETVIASPVSTIWALVTDIDLPARFSSEFLGARWLDDVRGVGARFVGRNQHPSIGEWQVECVIDVCERDRAFGWVTGDVDDPGARWRFLLDPVDGGTRLRFEVTLGPGPSGMTMAISSMPDKEARIIHRRIGELHGNMAATIEGVSDIVEAS